MRMESCTCALSGALIKSYADNCVREVVVYDTTSSTNDVCRAMGANGAAEGLVVVADKQTGGRGRLGRSFYSPSGSGVYFSILLDMSYDDCRLKAITPLAAVAVAEALEDVFCADASIKWVNDVYVNGGKCAGILTESCMCGDTLKVVVGIGINVSAPEGGFPEDIKFRAAAVTTGTADRNALVGCVLKKFFREYVDFDKQSLSERYAARCNHIGKSVSVIKDGTNTTAVCNGIDDDFNLMVTYPNGQEEKLFYGEISIKL